MNCQVFEKKLMDLIEDNITCDLKAAMMEHIDKCEHCRELYEKEMTVETALKSALGAEGIYFNSSRGDIMKNIDKNKYGKNPLKKLNYHIKKYSGLYAAAAVLIIATSFIVPYLLGGSSKGDMTASKMSSDSKVAGTSKEETTKQKEDQNTLKSEDNAAPKNNIENKKSTIVIPEDKNAPSFKKTVLQKTVEPSFNTPIQTSPNKKFEATVEGKGDAAQEEGIAKLFIKDLTTGGRWTFEIVQDQQKGQQNTPKYVKWVDDNNLLVIVGLGHGTVTRGGILYLMNADTGKLVNADIERKIDTSQGNKVEITKVPAIRSNELDVEINIYEDDNLMKSHIEKRSIPFPYEDLKQYVEAAQ
jgi:hypothetical protein